MNLIVCLDDNNGMAFNERRQSRDRTLTRKMIEMLNGHRVWMSPASAKMFLDVPDGIVISSDHYLQEAGKNDFCFVETDDLTAFTAEIQSITVFRWNRVYPADLIFPIDLSAWRKFYTEDFEGSSHEKITREMYVRE